MREAWEYDPNTTRICPKCSGTQMIRISALDDNPPKEAFVAFLQFGTVIHWMVWCDCKEGFV